MNSEIEQFIEAWRHTGGSELANTQSFINGLCAVLGVPQPNGSRKTMLTTTTYLSDEFFRTMATERPASAGSTATSETALFLKPSRAPMLIALPRSEMSLTWICLARLQQSE